MPVTHPHQDEQIHRRSWLLWGVTLAVVLTLAAAVPMIYVAAVRASGNPVRMSYPLVAGMGITVLLFCAYAVLKHLELERMRGALRDEERQSGESRSRLNEVLGLFEVTAGLDVHMRLDAVLEIIVRRVVAAVGAQQASVMMYDAETGMLDTRATYGLEAEFARNAHARLGEGIAGWVAERREAVLLGPRDDEHDLARHYKDDRNITSALSIPLRVGERCIGVLNVNRINHGEPFTERHRELLTTFAEHVGVAIERAETLERIGSRSRQLEADNEKLAEIGRLKDQFLGTATHELKTPLTAIIAYAELLHDSEASLDGRQRDEFVRRLRVEAERLLRLIEDILDLTRLESGKLDLNRVPLSVNAIAADAVETTRATAKKHGVRLVESYADDLPDVPLDEVKMRQVIVNLLVNGIRFSPNGGRVTLQTSREPRWIKIEVRDRGPGIGPDEATHVFELFGRRPGQETDAVGIGLHLVKRISELHGGHVGVNSVPGEGSSFWVRLPLALVEPGEAGVPEAGAVAEAAGSDTPAAAA